jgi:AcrR family transcriptional regulator
MAEWGMGQPTGRKTGLEVRERVLAEAESLLSETGLTVSVEHLNMEELIRRANVPRASVFREFGDRESLFTDLMLRMIKPDDARGAAFDEETITISRQIAEAHDDLLGTETGRKAVFYEAVRLGAEQNFHAICESPYWKTYMSLSMSLPSMLPERRVKVVENLRTVEERFISVMASYYDGLMLKLGRRAKEGITTRQIAAAGSAAVEGLAQRRLVNPELVEERVLMPDIHGNIVGWHLAAVAFLAAVEGMTVALTDQEFSGH